jgi:alkane 1-monooxygenase
MTLMTSIAPESAIAGTPGRDLKRLLWPVTLVMPLLPLVAIGLFAVTDNGIWLWLGPIVFLGLVPILDAIPVLNPSGSPDDFIEQLRRDRFYRWQTYLFLPLQYVGFLAGMWLIARGDLLLGEQVGMAVTVGFLVILGFNSAHELGHQRESVERWLSKIALAPCGYGHLYTEHNRGHHARVATPNDPTSSRLGESYYAFLVRAASGSLRGAWSIESRRCARKGHRTASVHNDVVNSWLMTAALWAGVLVWLGWSVLPFLVIQAMVAIALLEAVNYLEHYAMLRQRIVSNGREKYEPVRPRHSWNSDSVLTHLLLYRLQRHGAHHESDAIESRRARVSREDDESPVLPTGYAGMILLALVPPLWRRVMDPRVAKHYGGDLSRANIQPSQRHHYIPASTTSR